MLPSRILRAASSESQSKFDFARNPYKAKRLWPPDFDKLSERHQFRIERRYKRRITLKYIRPRWMAGTKLLQWVGCSSVIAYGVFFMDWEDDDKAFKGVRDWLRRQTQFALGDQTLPRTRPGASLPEPGSSG